MTTTTTSQTQNKEPSVDPMGAFTKMTEAHLARVQAFYDELAGWEAKAYDRAKSTAEHVATMASDSLAYAAKLSAEWRNLTLEATRRGAELFSARR